MMDSYPYCLCSIFSPQFIMLKRCVDLLFSAIGLILLLPLLLILALWVRFDSPGPAFYGQIRVGQGGRDFRLWKFRSMRIGSDAKGLLTVGGRDPRITRSGYYLRKYKLDELPQLWNVFMGEMSLVGPRPEVRKYVELYNPDQQSVLNVKPGITDLASLEYFKESELLAQSPNPEKTYVEEVMPKKLKLNQRYIETQSLATDFRIIFRTIKRIFE
jgi:lipopolysaccharide/colanic/teichoic acid biosynthesis glycosyltransferase